MNMMMQGLLSASLSGSLMVLVFLALRYLLNGHISRTGCYYIWLLILLRFLIPYSPIPGIAGYTAERLRQAAGRQQAAETGTQDSVPVMETAGGKGVGEASGTAGTDVPEMDVEKNTGRTAARRTADVYAAAMTERTSFTRMSAMIWLVWLLPALGLLALRIYRYRRFMKKLKERRTLPEDPVILHVCTALCREWGWKKEAVLYQCPGISSPILTGFLHPFLVLPGELCREWETKLTEEQRALRMEYVLRHELIHMKRLDLYYKWLVQAVVCVHWFNPLLQMAASKISEDCELSCDEQVIAGLPAAGRIAYGDTLIASLQALRAPVRQEACAGLGEKTELMKERLTAIMKYDKKAAGKRRAAAVMLAGLLLVTGFVCGGFSARAEGAAGINGGKTAAGGNAAGMDVAGKQPAKNTVTRGGETVPFWGEDSNYNNAWQGQFACSCFFKNGYLIQLAWNSDPENYRTVRNITAGERDWQIAFLDGTDSLAGDENFMEALKLCILVQKQREEKGGLSGFWNEKNKMKQPVVFYVEGPYTQTADELAEKTYDDEDSLLLYASVIDEVSPRTAKKLGERAYEDDDAAHFSLTTDSMSEDDRMAFAVRAYEEDNVAMFSIICDELTEAHRKQLEDRAKKDNQEMYYYILKNKEEG